MENVFTGQSVHTDDAVAENEPMLHALHVMGLAAPSTGEAVPAGQSMHDAPSLEPKVPLGHLSTRRMELESVVMVPWLKPLDTSCELNVCVLTLVPAVPSIFTSMFSCPMADVESKAMIIGVR